MCIRDRLTPSAINRANCCRFTVCGAGPRRPPAIATPEPQVLRRWLESAPSLRPQVGPHQAVTLTRARDDDVARRVEVAGHPGPSRDDVVMCETRLSSEDLATCGGLMVREPNELPLLERLTNHSGRLRPSELKVARAVLADPAAAVRVNMAALAANAGVSEPTVMRFCNGLGFDGFQSFRFALAEALAIGIPVTHSAISADDSVAEMATKIFDHTLSSLDRARRSLDTEAVTTAVDVLLEASRVVLVGLGASGIIAQDALQQAVLLGVPCAAPIDLHQQFMAASMMEPGSV